MSCFGLSFKAWSAIFVSESLTRFIMRSGNSIARNMTACCTLESRERRVESLMMRRYPSTFDLYRSIVRHPAPGTVRIRSFLYVFGWFRWRKVTCVNGVRNSCGSCCHPVLRPCPIKSPDDLIVAFFLMCFCNGSYSCRHCRRLFRSTFVASFAACP